MPVQKAFSHEQEKRRKEYLIAKQARLKTEPLKKKGISLFKEYDYKGAIETFEEALKIDDRDPATHFNLACAHSLSEDVDEAFYHLESAVAYGFNDFRKIKEHDALAYLRIQPEFDTFEQNGFRKVSQEQIIEAPQEDLLSTKPDLLDQLKKLADLKETGILTEEEFAREKKKLLG